MSSYKALYRKYRPQTFNDVSDQEYVTRTLINAIKQSRISHAYLFNGPRGIGKTSIARIFAKAINCEKPIDGEPCDECEVCKSIVNGSNPDIIEIDAASRTRVEQMRETLEKVNFLPTMSKYKVYIIDEVHMLSTSSFNALLKTLEEPPAHVIFILCTTEVEKVIPTIRSRCQRYDLHLISQEALEKRLTFIKEQENINITKEAISLVAEASEGGMRDALSLLDQISAFSLNDEITVDDVLEVSGRLSTDVLISIAESINDNDSSRGITLLDQLIKMGKEVEKITQALIGFYKDALVIKNTSKQINKVGYDKDSFKQFVQNVSNTKLYKYIEVLTDAMGDYKNSINKRLYLELAIIKMCDKTIFVEQPGVVVSAPQQTKVVSENYNPGRVYSNPFETKKEEKTSLVETKPVEKKEEQKTIEPVLNLSVLDEEDDEKEFSIPDVKEIKENQEPKPANPFSQIFDNIEKGKSEPVLNVEEQATENVQTANEPLYDIHFIEEVLNKADKPFKQQLIDDFSHLKFATKGTKHHNYALLVDGANIAASSRNAFIITFSEIGRCNLLMKKENYDGIKELIESQLDLSLDFIAIPFDLWKIISDEFVSIYKNNNKLQIQKYINLTYVDFPGLRINNKQINNSENKKEDKFQNLADMFKDILTIK